MVKIAVVGAGIVGATIAYSLSKRNVDLHIFDKQTETNDPTRYSIAWLNAFRKTPLDYYLFYNLGLHQWPWFNEEIGGDCDLTAGGALSVALSSDSKKILDQHIAPLFGWGYAVNSLNQNEIIKIESGVETQVVKGAAYCADEGYVDALKCTERLLKLAQERGAKLHRPQLITSLLHKDNRIHALQVDDKQLAFDYVILASGTTVSTLAATADVFVPQRNIPIFIIETAPCQKRFEKIAVMHIFSDRMRDLRQNPDGSFWISEVGEPNQAYPDPKAYAEKIYHEFTQIFPAAKDLSFTQRVVMLPKPSDGKSIFSFAPNMENLYIALSHSAVVIASQVGEWVAREVLDNVRIHWLEQFRLLTKEKYS